MDRVRVDESFQSMEDVIDYMQSNGELLFEVDHGAWFAHHETLRLRSQGKKRHVYGWVVSQEGEENDTPPHKFETLDDMLDAPFLQDGANMRAMYAEGRLHPCIYDE